MVIKVQEVQNYPLDNFWQFAHYHPYLTIILLLLVLKALRLSLPLIDELVQYVRRNFKKLGPVEPHDTSDSLDNKTMMPEDGDYTDGRSN